MKRRARPKGAARLELYFDMIPVGEPIPRRPDERGWPKFLESYTRSPMEVEFPVPAEPSVIVYWARWAGSKGKKSRWSKPCVARIEGWSSSKPALPEGEAAQHERRVETKVVYLRTPIAGELPAASAEGGSMAQQWPGDVFQELSRLLEGDGALGMLRERLLGPAEEESMRLLDEK